MTVVEFSLAGLVAVLCGLDRMALCQFMISRPVVAAPLAGLVLGEPMLGLTIGALVELLWLGRLPVGATIPPDDTQIAVGGTCLAIHIAASGSYSEPVSLALALMIAMPLAKSGQLFDHMARRANDNLGRRVERFLHAGEFVAVERGHLLGLVHFAVAAFFTFAVVTGLGSLISMAMVPLVAAYLEPAGYWLLIVFPLTGAAMILRSIRINHSITLFSASFASALLMLWLL